MVVSETLGNYPFEENIVDTLNDARARFLNPGGVIIPHAVEQFVCPVTAERFYRELAAWDEVGYGLDFAPAKTMTLNNIYVRWFEAAGPARRAARPRSRGTSSPSTAATRRRVRARRPGAVEQAHHRSTAWRCGGRRSWCPACRWRPVRWTRARTGSSSTCRRWRRSRSRPAQTLTARLRSTTSYERGTNMTWTLAVRDATGRERAAPGARPGEGLFALAQKVHRMKTYVALLRAINVGGTGKLPMAQLKAMGERIGGTNVRTYIASGNVVLDSPKPAAQVKQKLEVELARYAGEACGRGRENGSRDGQGAGGQSLP